MSEPKTALVKWTQEDLSGLKARALALTQGQKERSEYIGLEFMEIMVLLGAAAKRVLQAAGETESIDDAAKLYNVGQKLSGQWLDVAVPLAKRHPGESEGGKTKQVSGTRGLRPRLGGGPGGGAGQAEPQDERPPAGGDSPLVEGPVESPDGERS